MLTEYTTYDDIRAALGVSSDDLGDETLGLNLYENLLQGELEDVALTLPATYASTLAVASPTDVQTRFLQAASVFATFAVAKQLTTSLPMFAARQVTDSKAGVTRFDNPYVETIKAVSREYEKARARLAAALGAVGTTTTTATARVFMSVVSPTSDPVLGT